MKTLFTLGILLSITTSMYTQTQLGSDIDGDADGDRFGFATSFNYAGDVLVVGAFANDDAGTDAGHVRAFNWNGSEWIQVGNTILGQNPGDWAGISVGINNQGNAVAVGARQNDANGNNAGSAAMYSWNGINWIARGSIQYGLNVSDLFGFSIESNGSGDTVAIGATGVDHNGLVDAGAVYVKSWNGTDWVNKGNPIYGEGAGDAFGYDIALSEDGHTIAIGAPANDGNGINSGHVRVFGWNGTDWIQRGTDIDSEAADDRFGNALAMRSDGTIIFAGALRNDGAGPEAGHVRAFTWNGTDWVQKGTDIDGVSEGDFFGRSIDVSEDGITLVVGAHQNDSVNGVIKGAFYIYEWNGTDYVRYGVDIYGDAPDDEFGSSVSISGNGNRIICGASRNDDNGTDAGHVKVYQLGILGTETFTNEQVVLYPNPTKERIHFSVPKHLSLSFVVTVRNALGQQIDSFNFSNTKKGEITINGSAGIYLVEFETFDKAVTIRQKVIKQ